MKKELQEKLFNDFPLLYQDKDLPMTQTCMCWGIDTGNGWFNILYELSEKLYPLILQWKEENPDDPDHPRASQVKEKFGTLRFYMTHSTDEMEDLIDEAERKTAITCETCGAPGETTNNGWVFTLCEGCAKLRQEDAKAFLDKLRGE